MNTERMVSILAIVFAGATVAPVQAQTASALYQEGQQLPGAPAGQLVSSLNNPAVNHVGGFAGQVNTSDGVTTLSHVWGDASGGAGTVIRTEGTFGSLTQTSYESFYGISDSGQVSYSATVTGGVVASGDSVWLDDAPVAVEGDPHPTLPGQFWSFGSRPGVSAAGTPYFVGGIATSAGGSTANRGLFHGIDGGNVLLLGGQTPPNLPRALTMTGSPVDFDYRFAANGVDYIAPVQMISPTSDDAAIVVSGSGLLVGGSLVQESTAIPMSAGGQVGENWANFDFTGVSNNGDYFFSGDSSLATTADEFIFKNGQMLYRDGMMLDGETLQGDIEAAYMNEDGDISFIWDIQGNTLEALYFNDNLLLKEGDLVDLDGDGFVEPNSVLVNFTGISSLAMGDQDVSGFVDIYFTADIDVNGTSSTTDDIEGFFVINIPEPGVLSLLALAALGLVRRRR